MSQATKKFLKFTFARLARIMVATLCSTVFTAAIAAHYSLPVPGWRVCLWALLLLEIAGQSFRGFQNE